MYNNSYNFVVNAKNTIGKHHVISAKILKIQQKVGILYFTWLICRASLNQSEAS